MARRTIKVSDEVFDLIQSKKQIMQNRVSRLGIRKSVSVNKVLKVFVGTPIIVSDRKLVKLVLKKKRYKKC